MSVFAVTTARGPAWDHARGTREQVLWKEHAGFMDDLTARGVIILGGPVASDDPADIALLAVEAADAAAVRALFAADPWAERRVYRLKEIRAWSIWLDGRRRDPRRADPSRGPRAEPAGS